MSMNDMKSQPDTPANENPSADPAAEAARDAEAAAKADAEAAIAAAEERDAEAREPEDLAEEDLVELVRTLEKDLAQARDERLRAVAEAENTRRRLQKDRDDAVRFATKGIATDFLTVADNIARALESIPRDALKDDPALKALADGVKLTEAELQRAFEKHGITRIDPLGEKLDPNLHQAMMQIEDADAPDGTIVQVLAPGYMLHDRLLRAAMVGVAKGGPRSGAAKPAAPAAGVQGNTAPGGTVDTEA